VPSGGSDIAAESATVRRSFCGCGVGAQRVRAYGCTSSAPTSHLGSATARVSCTARAPVAARATALLLTGAGFTKTWTRVSREVN
jgi:hypothetical protein